MDGLFYSRRKPLSVSSGQPDSQFTIGECPCIGTCPSCSLLLILACNDMAKPPALPLKDM
jgi:hypothetical protein